MTLSNKPKPGRRVLPGWQKQVEECKAEAEKAEPTKDKFGNTSVTKINSQTHSEVVLSNETIKQLIEYGRKDE